MFKFKFQVIADSSGTWAGNAMTYDTQKEAEDAARNLESRWMLVREWRVLQQDSATDENSWAVIVKLQNQSQSRVQ